MRLREFFLPDASTFGEYAPSSYSYWRPRSDDPFAPAVDRIVKVHVSAMVERLEARVDLASIFNSNVDALELQPRSGEPGQEKKVQCFGCTSSVEHAVRPCS